VALCPRHFDDNLSRPKVSRVHVVRREHYLFVVLPVSHRQSLVPFFFQKKGGFAKQQGSVGSYAMAHINILLFPGYRERHPLPLH